MSELPRISDALFNGFVDGRLPARGDREIAIALETDPAAAARAATWRRQSEALRTAFAPIADEPLPLSLILKVRASLPESRRGRTVLWPARPARSAWRRTSRSRSGRHILTRFQCP